MPPRQAPTSATGSGGLSISGLPVAAGGAGESLQDTSPGGFWAIITGHPNPAANAYAFVRVDDSAPPAFPALVGAPQTGDGIELACYEMSGALTVPVNAVVWLEPLRLAVGYGFTYSAAGALVWDIAIGGYYNLAGKPAGTFVTTTCVLTIPSAGNYLITANVAGSVSASAVAMGTAAAVYAGLKLSTGGVLGPTSPGEWQVVAATAPNVYCEAFSTWVGVYTAGGPLTMTLEAYWTGANMTSACIGSFQNPALGVNSSVTYLKLS